MSPDPHAPAVVESFDTHPDGITGLPIRRIRAGRVAKDCPVCLNRHDDEIHQATLSVRRWFRREVNSHLAPIVANKPHEVLPLQDLGLQVIQPDSVIPAREIESL